MNKTEYQNLFAEPKQADISTDQTVDTAKSKERGGSENEAGSRAGRALAYSHEIRKFEIELYWKRATYFWTLIGAAFAAYALTYKTAAEHEPWLSLIFSSLGLIFSFAWYLVNRGSKYWQNNWERHVDLLEDLTLGPLYKTIAEEKPSQNFITSSGPFSVSKLNQILSLFVTAFWIMLVTESLLPISCDLGIDPFKLGIVALTVLCLIMLYTMGRSSNDNDKTSVKLKPRIVEII